MEEAPLVSSFTPKRPWYRTGWGEFLLVFLGIVGVLTGAFFGAVAFEIKNFSSVNSVADIKGDGEMSVSRDAKPVSDVSGKMYIENSSMALGSPNADLKIVEFVDFGCPFTEQASRVMREMAAKYPLRFRYVIRDFPIISLHPNAELAAIAARCAAAQGKFWAYHDKLFANQDAQDSISLLRYASEIGANTDDFASCFTSRKYAREVQADFEAGTQAGLRGTPTFFLNDVRAEGPLPADKLEALILKFPEKATK
ncbi:MAG: DsbA family protein [bacterium]